jgi:hypothetical protein
MGAEGGRNLTTQAGGSLRVIRRVPRGVQHGRTQKLRF